MADLAPEVRELLEARNMAHVATLMADGTPHVSPIWIAVEVRARRSSRPRRT